MDAWKDALNSAETSAGHPAATLPFEPATAAIMLVDFRRVFSLLFVARQGNRFSKETVLTPVQQEFHKE